MVERETRLAQTFVALADTLVADFDVLDFLTVLTNRCVELFDVSQAGLMLANPPDHVSVAASSSHQAGLLELFEIQHDEGPCLDCYRSGSPVRCEDLGTALDRWPVFAPEAVAAGFGAVYALPMRIRDQTIGSLNLLRAEAGVLDDADLIAAQALADVATIGILQHRAAAEYRLLAEQLQYALNSRITTEQAKGVIAEYSGVDMDSAFAALRRYARDHNERLVEVAGAVVARSLPAAAILGSVNPGPGDQGSGNQGSGNR